MMIDALNKIYKKVCKSVRKCEYQGKADAHSFLLFLNVCIWVSDWRL